MHINDTIPFQMIQTTKNLIDIVTLLLVLNASMALNTSVSQEYIEKIDHNPGIYFERMQDIRFEIAEWKILVFTDHRSLEYKPDAMRKIMRESHKKCMQLQGKPTQHFCTLFEDRLKLLETRLEHLDSTHAEIVDTMEEVESKTQSQDNSVIKTIRKRSAPLGFLGSLGHLLFGTLTEEEGNFYTTKINELFKGQVKLAHLAKQNMHLVHQKIEGFEEKINEQEKRISIAIDKLKKITHLTDLSSIWEYVTFDREFTSITNNIESALNLYENNFHQLLEITRAARVHHLHPSLLPLSRLQQIIRNIEDSHPNHRFPIPIEHARADKLSDIASVKLAFRDEKFLVEVTIPLTDKVSTELYKIHPIPIPQTEGNHTISAYIMPQETYIAIGHDKRTYSFLSEDQWKECKETPYFKLCINNIPILDANENSTCEYLLLTNPTLSNLRKCEIKVLPNHRPFVKHLDTLQAWILSMDGNHNILINCPGELHQILTFSGIGILHLRPSCTARLEGLTLTSLKTIGSNEVFLYLSLLTLNLTTLDSAYHQRIRFIAENHQYLFNHPQIADLNSGISLAEIESKYDEFLDEKRYDILQPAVTYSSFSTSFIVLIIVLLTIFTCVKRKMNKKKLHT